MPALLDSDLDMITLEDILGDMTPKCDNDTCNNDATHTITCGHCGKGVEFSCQKCIEEMKKMSEENFLYGALTFDAQKSCGHTTFITLCRIDPL